MLEKIIKENEKIHNLVAKKYNTRHIEIYNEVEQSRVSKVIKNLLNRFDKNNLPIKVLDYGSGTGNLTKFFLQNKCNVTSLDISDKSLSLLSKLYSEYEKKLNITKFDGYDIPFGESNFDIVATYSVLHHIPDYMKAIYDMIRVVKKGGYLYIDHEANKNNWNPSSNLLQYNKLSNSFFKKLKGILFTGELFEFSFWKGVFIRKFINPRYVIEGDIHVWKDDFIDWDKIIKYLMNNGFEIIEDIDYLQFHPYISIDEYNKFKDKINNTKYIIARKL